ncbi:DUF3775 domain-containing protein [Lamprobacter modestohalophilus]|uniref:DUF3775 domain-containing protein n=1 Tax=Lamprobacter modestohalophilus TaxID=1064514 RepID=A0A9X0WCK3_9GAMM|nr:DUF3775 domain-containing protein [Lamprobacter modestohalophilus]MBK1621177.1 hypothetical protein [Lamprobacter modestohalophilus]MCF7994601.1 DUF3775 domain-containing protein [Chromatiaceae bacterium]MCF8014840.1 DUF3775 domain-containing protein [Chromatiaceae bacterium]MEA1048493.1 DUF3775 domain-containing protein [Lamprobacter modestohalophilus]
MTRKTRARLFLVRQAAKQRVVNCNYDDNTVPRTTGLEEAKVRLHIPLDTLCSLIELAREFQAKESVVIPEVPSSPSDDWAMQVLADHGDDYNVAEFSNIVTEMSERQRSELVALMWVGRGDYSIEEWEQAVDDALGDFSIRAAAYVLAHPMVSDHLEEGMIAFELSCEED